MDRKKRRTIFIFSITFVVAGFACIFIGASFQGHVDSKVVTIIGLSSFLFWGLGLIVLLKNLPEMMASVLDETAEKMYGEKVFFSEISAKETPRSLVEKFQKAGFVFEGDYLHKRRPSAVKDYINYHVVLAEEVNIEEHFQAFLESYEKSPPDRCPFHKNNVYYMVYFSSTIPDEALKMFKTCIVNEGLMQDISSVPWVFLPIVYDTGQEKYIIRSLKGKHTMNLLQMALKYFYKVVWSADDNKQE